MNSELKRKNNVKKYDENFSNKICIEYENSNISCNSLANKLGCSKSYVLNTLKKNNITIVKKARTIAKKQIGKLENEPIQEMYEFLGLEVDLLCKLYNVSKQTIRKYIKFKKYKIDYLYDELKTEIESGKSVKNLSKDYGFNVSTIYNFIKRHNISIKKQKNKKKTRVDIIDNDLISDYNSGILISELRSKYKCSNNVIYRILKKNKAIMKSTKNKIDENTCVDLYKSGKSTVYISNLLNCDATTVSNILERCGVKRNNTYTESSLETIVIDLLKSHDISFIQNYKMKSGREIDIFLPKYVIGIECHGLYWHSEKFRNSNYHYEKYKEAENIGIKLLQFWETDILENFNIIEKIILSNCGLLTNRIHAKNCTFDVVEESIANKFHDSFNIQGSVKSTIHYGLYHKKSLKFVCSFLNINSRWNLTRFSFSCHVVDGLSNIIKNVPFDEIFTFSNNMYSNEDIYISCGFQKEYSSNPDYKYLYNKQLYHKFESNLREQENILRVYDAGHVKWQLSKK